MCDLKTWVLLKFDIQKLQKKKKNLTYSGTKYDESQHIDATYGKKVEVRNCPIREIA
jgi:hypothetical protein